MTETKQKRNPRTFTDEFKKQLVNLYLNGKRKCDIKKYQGTGFFKKKDNRSDLENELIELRKRNKQLEMENDILKQAALILGRK